MTLALRDPAMPSGPRVPALRPVTLAQGRLVASRLGFGTSTLHHLKSAGARHALLARAQDLGITYFDTAPLYGHTLAERALGRFARGQRHGLVLATKFGIAPDRWLARSPVWLYGGLALRAAASRARLWRAAPWRRDYTAAAMRASLERSLGRLGTDRVDVLYVHEPALALGFSDDLARALEQVRTEGKVRLVGLSGSRAECLAIAARYPAVVDLLQLEAEVTGGTAASARAAGLGPCITFGHLRQRLDPASGGRGADALARHLGAAANDNADGVILFSARSVPRLESFVATFATADAAAGALW